MSHHLRCRATFLWWLLMGCWPGMGFIETVRAENYDRLLMISNNVMATGEFPPGTNWQTIKFISPVGGRYFSLKALSSQDGQPYAAIAELQLLGSDGLPLSREGWRVACADSEERVLENGAADNLLDSVPGTYWQTQWSGNVSDFPHWIVLDLGRPQVISGFRYLPRQGDPSALGRIKGYEASVADDFRSVRAPLSLVPDHVFLFSYFTDNDAEGLHLAWSLDGYSWEAVNQGMPVMFPQLPGVNLLRDPCLLQGPDGTFHLVWTKYWTGDSIGYASSKDLIHWENQREIPVMAAEAGTRNCWAPEVYWDAKRSEYLIIWASAVTGAFNDALTATEPENNQRIYYTTTKDFKTFAPTQLFYDAGIGVIDPTILAAGERYYLIMKDETSRPRVKRLRLAVADDLRGPYGTPSQPFSPQYVEGPAAFFAGDHYVCLFHYNIHNSWGAMKSTDLTNWSDVTERLALPPGAHPGTVLEVKRDVLLRLWGAGRAEIGPAPEVADLNLGHWIWTDSVQDKQTCRLLRVFQTPPGMLVSRATLHITADNGYRAFLDGREIGRGGDYNDLTEYDLTQLLPGGTHTLAVEGFNDALAAGVIAGLHIQFLNGQSQDVVSDQSWWVAPADDRNWTTRTDWGDGWKPARIVGFAGKFEWNRPKRVLVSPPLLPQQIQFWQRGWFLSGLVAAFVLAVLFGVRQGLKLAVQTRSQRLLERERARIASDMHDDLGSGLTQLTLLGELAMRDLPADGDPRARVMLLCTKARTLLRTMDEIIWVVNPRRDTVNDFVAYVSEHAQEYLTTVQIRCRQEIAELLPAIPLDLPRRRNLLLAVKEAIRNAARHSGAQEIVLKIDVVEDVLRVTVQDDGKGFTVASGGTRNGLANMRQRLSEVGGTFQVQTAPGQGCTINFQLPLLSRDLNSRTQP